MMNSDIWWGVSLSFRLCRGVYLRVSGPALWGALALLIPIAIGWFAIWLEVVLPINIIRWFIKQRRGHK